MGEIIKREFPDMPMHFTGERFTTQISGQTAIEHLHRALMARSFCHGKDVLDIACGEGYCSALISSVAHSVTGVDISAEAVNHARLTYARENLVFKEGNATNIPANDHSFDIVVSFETIEHFAQHEIFMKEIKRVLKPGGMLLISTPDPAIYSPEGQPANPFHVKELSREEFRYLLNDYFSNVVYLGQRTVIGSALFEVDTKNSNQNKSEIVTYEARASNAYERSIGLPRAKYIIALASEDEGSIRNLEQSIFIATSEIDAALDACPGVRRDLERAMQEKVSLETRLKSDIETVTAWFENEKSKAESLRLELEHTQSELAQSLAARHDLEIRLKSDIETVTAWFENEKSKVESLQLELEHAQSATAQEAASRQSLDIRLRGEIETLRLGLEAADLDVFNLRIEVDRLKHELDSCNETKIKAEDSIMLLRQELNDCLAANLSLTRLEDSCRSEVASLIEDLKSLEMETINLREKVEITEDKLQLQILNLSMEKSRLEETQADAALISLVTSGGSADVGFPKRLLKAAREAGRNGDLHKAAAYYRTAAFSCPSNKEAWQNFAACLNRMDAHHAALRAWQHAVNLDPYDAVAQDGLGATFAVIGREDEARAAFCKAFISSPNLAGPRQRLENAGFSTTQRVDMVLSSSEPRPRRPEAPFTRALDSYLGLRARVEEKRGNVGKAVSIYQDVVDRCTDATNLIKYGDAISHLIGVDGAEGAYLKAYTLAPQNPDVQRRVDDLKNGDLSFKVNAKSNLLYNVDATYLTLSNDPQFLLDPGFAAMPSGWTLFSISVSTFGRSLRPVLYVWHGKNGRSLTSFTLPPVDGGAVLECLVPLPKDTKSLRLDPTNEEGVQFGVNRIGWRNANSLEGRIFQTVSSRVAFAGDHMDLAGQPVQPFVTVPLDLTPIHDLETLENGALRSTGNDAQLSVTPTQRLPSGWTWIELSVGRLEAQLNPVLYVWTNSSIVSVSLPALVKPGKSSFLVKLPDHVNSIRLDPTDEVNVSFSDIKLSSCDVDVPSLRIFAPATNINADDGLHYNVSDPVQLIFEPEFGLEKADGDFYTGTEVDSSFRCVLNEELSFAGPTKLRINFDHANTALDIRFEAFDDVQQQDVRCDFHALESERYYSYYLVIPRKAIEFRVTIKNARGVYFSRPEIILYPAENIDDAIYVPAQKGTPVARNGHGRLTPLLEADHQLEATRNGFISRGDDPQFKVTFSEAHMPSGWQIISLDMSVKNNIGRSILYVWSDVALHIIQLAPVSANGSVQQLVRLPDVVKSMRFDPVDQDGVEFSVPQLSFMSPSAFAGTLLKRHARGSRDLEYGVWCETYDELTSRDLALLVESQARFSAHPLISIVMPVYNPEKRFLCKAIDSILAQTYQNWELCIAEDCSPNEDIRTTLREFEKRDHRIKVIFRTENGHISEASNSAIDLVTGSFVALMDHDDELPAHALYMVAREINDHPDVDVIYTDEDKIDANGRRHDPYFKTDWNQELFYSQNMIAHLGVYRTSLVREVGGFRKGFEGSQDYDFSLRVLKRTSGDRIRHIPHVLYHWRIFEGVRTFSSNNPQRSVDTAGRALREYFDVVEPDSEVLPIPAFPGWWRIKRALPERPLVSIIIPTRDKVELVRNCVDGLLNRTLYTDIEIIIVDNGSVQQDTLQYFSSLNRDSRVRVIRDDGRFNYSRLNNEAVSHAKGEYVCFLNNDIEVIEGGWLNEMMSQVLRPGVGAVGAKLLYGTDTIQHAGVTLGVYGVAAHGHRHFPADSIGYFGHPQLVREASAVTGAALLMPKALFVALGGFDVENLSVSYNDVDLCLRINQSGHRVVYTPFSTLYHLESASRGPDVRPEQKELQRIERGYMLARWGEKLDHDPHYNVNLTLTGEDYRLAFPPRRSRPWLEEADVAENLARVARSALPTVDLVDVRSLASDTVVVIASQAPFDVLSNLARDLSVGGILPQAVIVVDNTDRRSSFVREGVSKRFRVTHPSIPLNIVNDPSQDFSAARVANLGLGAVSQEAQHVVLILEDCAFTKGWFVALMEAWIAAGDRNKVLSPEIFIRENEARNELLTDGFIEVPVSRAAPSASEILPVTNKYEELPVSGRLSPDDAVKRDQAIEESFIPSCGVVMANRSLLTADEDGHVFDPLFLTLPSALEDFSWRLKQHEAVVLGSMAPLLVRDKPRHFGIEDIWQLWHDYTWLNRKIYGFEDDKTIEFICPFHRGDVLIGLQVANTAFKAGLRIRFHVAESLLGWVNDFAPPFPVEGLPVRVPPAHETALYLLRSYEHVIARPDSSPRLARSHPFRGLDAMNGNLASAMLTAVGLPIDTLLENIAPRPTAKQEKEVSLLLEPYGDNIVLLHKSGGWGLKTIPEPILSEFSYLVKKAGFKLVQIGGPGEQACEQADGIIAGDFSAGHWSAIFAKSKIIAGVDSWSSHMASILDVPQITFYGSTHPNHVASKNYFRQKVSPALLVQPTVACSPCNSLSCLIQSEPFCPGFNLPSERIINFLKAIRQG